MQQRSTVNNFAFRQGPEQRVSSYTGMNLLIKVDLPVPIFVDLVDHVLHLIPVCLDPQHVHELHDLRSVGGGGGHNRQTGMLGSSVPNNSNGGGTLVSARKPMAASPAFKSQSRQLSHETHTDLVSFDGASFIFINQVKYLPELLYLLLRHLDIPHLPNMEKAVAVRLHHTHEQLDSWAMHHATHLT